MIQEQLNYLNTLSDKKLETLIDLSENKSEQEITNFLNNDYMLISDVEKNYTKNGDIDYTKIEDDELLSELGNRSWIASEINEINEIYDIIKDDINIDNDDLYQLFYNLSKTQQKILIDDINNYEQQEFKCNTIYDEMKLDILKDLFKDFSLEQLQQIKK